MPNFGKVGPREIGENFVVKFDYHRQSKLNKKRVVIIKNKDIYLSIPWCI